MPEQISIINILKQSGKFNLVNTITYILSMPKTIIIAMVLVPKDYGIINFLGLWSIYAALIHPGFVSARSREMAHLLGAGDERGAMRIQNISHTSDFIYSIIPFVVILFAAFFFSDKVLKAGLIITAFAYAFNHLVNYWRGVNFVRQRFSLVAWADLIKSVSTVLVMLALIFWIKIYAVLVAPIIAAFLAGIYYWRKGKIGYQLLFDWPQTLRLFKIGISLSMLALVYWGYRLVDKTIIASFLPLSELGIYSYAAVFIFLGMGFLGEFGSVFTPILWTKIGQAENKTSVFYDTKRIIIYLSIVTAMLIPLSHVCFYFLVKLLTKKYIASIPIFIVLSCNLYLATIVGIPLLILKSSVVNKQVLSLKTYLVGLILNIVLDIFAIRLGYGIGAVALITVVMQGLVTLIHFYLTRNYIFYKNREVPAFILSIGMPFLLSLAFCFFHSYLLHRIAKPWFFAAISIPIQMAIWGAMIGLFYRKYFSRDKFNKVIKEVAALKNNLWIKTRTEHGQN